MHGACFSWYKYTEKTGRHPFEYQELHDLSSLNFDYTGALTNAMNGHARVKRNVIGDALQYLTGVAGPTEVAMDHKQFAVIELEPAKLNNMTVRNYNDLQIVKKTMNRQANNMRNLRKVVENELSETENAERQIN